MKRTLVLVALVSAGSAHLSRAQCAPGGPPNPATTPRAITGIVMDTAHVPLANVTVAIRNPRRSTKTNAQGRFQLADLDTGTYEISVFRIGYEGALQSYVVTDTGGVARFCLIPEARALPTMVTSSTRPGLAGVVGDSNYAVLEGAEVRALGGGAHALTDSAGGFYLPLKSGTYPIVITKPGYGRQLISVTIPSDSGRQIAVWLGSPALNANRMAAALDSMHDRILWARPNRTALVSSEELAKFNVPLAGVAQLEVKAKVLDICEAVIDGGPFTLPLFTIDKADVAMMEVYIAGPARDMPRSINPAGTSPSRAVSALGGGCPSIYVWMKP
jgi:hypothetical protein